MSRQFAEQKLCNYNTLIILAGIADEIMLLLTLLSVFLPTSSFAQGVLEEVVVTAQKREQGLQDVGIAITAFTGEQMKALGIEESFDIAAFSPGVHISGNLAGQNTQFSIRGVTQNDFNDVIEAPTAVYLDEVTSLLPRHRPLPCLISTGRKYSKVRKGHSMVVMRQGDWLITSATNPVLTEPKVTWI